jgi:hypothetical protein
LGVDRKITDLTDFRKWVKIPIILLSASFMVTVEVFDESRFPGVPEGVAPQLHSINKKPPGNYWLISLDWLKGKFTGKHHI